MQRTDTVIERGHRHIVVAECATSANPDLLAMPPVFLVLPHWTVEETATYLRCEAQTIRKAISQKGEYHGLKPRRFGRRWYFCAADVRSMLEAA